jgi:hypothetical protein
LEEDIKTRWYEIRQIIHRAGRTSWSLFPLPIIENSEMVTWATAWQKNNFCTTILGVYFKSKNHSKYLLGPYECKLQ